MAGNLHWLRMGCFFVFTSVTFLLVAQNRDEFNLMLGNVKSVNEITYRAVAQNGVIVKGEILTEYPDTFFSNKDLRTPDVCSTQNSTDSISRQYDKEGRCIKMNVFYPDKQLRESHTLVYNDQGKLKLCIIRSPVDDEVDAISYSYDPYGKLAILIHNRKGGDMHQQRFAYDKKGNWIVRVDFKDYDPIHYVERLIEYYPD